jgi:predicted aspartyl protease
MTPFKYPRVFARVTGRNGRVYEYLALLSTASEYSVLPRVDAYRLGYTHVLEDPITAEITFSPHVVTFVSATGFEKGSLVVVDRVSVGESSVEGLECIAYDLPQESGVDLILGLNFLSRSGLKPYIPGTLKP